MTDSEIAQIINQEILKQLGGKPLIAFEECMNSNYLSLSQDYSNTVSIKRLKMNDHGKVHMRKVTNYAIQISTLLNENGIHLSGQTEGWCEYEDSVVTIILSSFLHDIGMVIHRQNHEFYTLLLVDKEVDRILSVIYGEADSAKKFALKCLVIESISGHMGHQQIASLEAGILLVADGCDLEFGRAKPATNVSINGRIGDIHRYSASCVEKVTISAGDIKPVKISIQISEYAGFFQIEEILMQKILKSTIKEHVEVVGFLDPSHPKKYL